MYVHVNVDQGPKWGPQTLYLVTWIVQTSRGFYCYLIWNTRTWCIIIADTFVSVRAWFYSGIFFQQWHTWRNQLSGGRPKPESDPGTVRTVGPVSVRRGQRLNHVVCHKTGFKEGRILLRFSKRTSLLQTCGGKRAVWPNGSFQNKISPENNEDALKLNESVINYMLNSLKISKAGCRRMQKGCINQLRSPEAKIRPEPSSSPLILLLSVHCVCTT